MEEGIEEGEGGRKKDERGEGDMEGDSNYNYSSPVPHCFSIVSRQPIQGQGGSRGERLVSLKGISL